MTLFTLWARLRNGHLVQHKLQRVAYGGVAVSDNSGPSFHSWHNLISEIGRHNAQTRNQSERRHCFFMDQLRGAENSTWMIRPSWEMKSLWPRCSCRPLHQPLPHLLSPVQRAQEVSTSRYSFRHDLSEPLHRSGLVQHPGPDIGTI